MRNKLYLFTVALMLFFLQQSQGQSAFNSPYTKFGLGHINSLESAFQMGQGGLSYTDAYYNQVNVSNPASYSFIARHLPVFDISVGSDFIDARSVNSSRLYTSTYMSNFTLGLPTGRRSGLVLSYQPFSRMGYNITDTTQTIDGFRQINKYKGESGTNRLTLGYGHLVYKSDSSKLFISAGLNASYLFGAVSNTRQSEFEEGSGYLSFLDKDTSSIKDVYFEGGLYARYIPNKTNQYGFAITYTHNTNINATNEQVAYTYFNSVLAVIDTFEYSGKVKGSYMLPGAIGVGFSVNHKQKIGGGIQFTTRNMSNFSANFGQEEKVAQFSANNQLALGMWLKPSASAEMVPGNSFKNATYKFGLRYQTLGLVINSTEITEMAVSSGLSLPLVASGSLSSINFGIEVGIRGTTNNSLVEERFARLKIGVAITPSKGDRWFVKRKYD